MVYHLFIIRKQSRCIREFLVIIYDQLGGTTVYFIYRCTQCTVYSRVHGMLYNVQCTLYDRTQSQGKYICIHCNIYGDVRTNRVMYCFMSSFLYKEPFPQRHKTQVNKDSLVPMLLILISYLNSL